MILRFSRLVLVDTNTKILEGTTQIKHNNTGMSTC